MMPFLCSNNNVIYAHVQYKKGATEVDRRFEKNSERKKPKLLDMGIPLMPTISK